MPNDTKLHPALFTSLPQITFTLPDGPYEVIENPPGVVSVFAPSRKHPILIMPKHAADQLGWIPDPPTSGVRVVPDNPDEEEDDG